MLHRASTPTDSDQTHVNHQSDQMNLDDESIIQELAFCPYCDQEVTVEGIYCIECESWLHYECVNLNPDTVSDTFKDTEYVCDQFNEETLYGDGQSNAQEPVSEQISTDDTPKSDPPLNSQTTGANDEWYMPSAMSDTGAPQKTLLLGNDPNPTPSRSQADMTSLVTGVDRNPAPQETSPISNSQTELDTHSAHISQDKPIHGLVQLKEPPVRLNTVNSSHSPKTSMAR